MNREANPSPTSADPEVELVPVFTTGNFAEMEIVTDIFEEEQIAYRIRRREMAAFPTTIGEHDQIRVYVEPAQIDNARQFIQQALVDEAIPGDGNFIEADERDQLEKVQKSAEKRARQAEKEAQKAEKRAEKHQKKAEKKAKKDEKKAEAEQKRAQKEAEKAERAEKKAEKLERQAAKLEKKAEEHEKKAQKKRDEARKKREKAEKKRG